MHTEQTHARRTCGAPTRDGDPCKLPPLIGGNGRCRMHNGRAARGAAASGWIDGRTAKYAASGLPKDLLDMAQDAAQSAAAVDLRPKLGILEAILFRKLSALTAGGGDAWAELKRTMLAWDAEARKGESADQAAMAGYYRAAFDLVMRGASDFDAMEAAERTIDRYRKMVETETRRTLAAKTVVSAEQVIALIGGIVDVFASHVADIRILAAVQADINRIIRPVAARASMPTQVIDVTAAD